MAVVVIHAPSLSAAAKKRIGDQIITALHNEDVPASSVVVLFKVEKADLYLDGGVLIEAQPSEAFAPMAMAHRLPTDAQAAQVHFLSIHASPKEDFKTRARRTKQELAELKAKLITLLHEKGG